MKIYRGDDFKLTDSKKAESYIKNWRPGARIPLEATKTKDAWRRTHLELEVETDDVIALSKALLDDYRQKARQSRALQRTYMQLSNLLCSREAIPRSAIEELMKYVDRFLPDDVEAAE